MNQATKIIILTVLISFSLLLANLSLVTAQDRTLSAQASAELTKQDDAFISAAGLGKIKVSKMISLMIKLVLSFVGVFFIILLIYAGYSWMVSGGNEEKVTKAKKTIVAAVIGLAIILSAYIITVFVIDRILGATGVTTFF